MRRCLTLTLLLGWSICAVSPTAVAQQSTPAKSFEVASVRIATSGGMSVFLVIDHVDKTPTEN